MSKKSMALVVALVITSISAVGKGQNKDGITAPNAIDAKKASAIRHLLELNGSNKLAKQVWDQLFQTVKTSSPQVPSSVWQEMDTEFQADINGGKFIEMMVPIYSRAFTEQEVNELVKFYESQIGRKLTSALPQILSESMAAGQDWALEVLTRLRTRLKEKGYSVSTD
jgi:hypothetical protein